MLSHFDHLSDSEFEELKNVYYSQAYEAVENLQDLLLVLETSSEDEVTLKTIKRYVHTLKGDSNSIGLVSIGTLCHSVEDILSSLTDNPGDLKHECIDLLLSGVDVMSKLLSESEAGTAATGTDEIMEKIDAFLQKGTGQQGETPPSFPLRQEEAAGFEMGHTDQRSHLNQGITEYQELQIQDALNRGSALYELEIVFHPMCADRGPAAFMVTQLLSGMGQVIRSIPEVESAEIEKADRITFLFCSSLSKEQIKRDAFVTGIMEEIHIRDFDHSSHGTRSPQADIRSEVAGQPSSSNYEMKPSNARSEMLRIEASRVDSIMDLAGELIIGRSMVEQVARDLEDGASRDDIVSRLLAANSYMERTVSDLQKGIMKMRMVPVNHVLRKFPKIVRDLCAENGKKVRLDIRGKETELDKSIVDALGEPLSHIIRNFIDHGIEDPVWRRSAGKPEEGVITLNAYHEAAQIVIEASDDGRGIDREKLRKKAIEKGLLTEAESDKLTDHEAIDLIFVSGLSTSETVSETSGRGVGMDAVKSAVNAMKGSIEVESTPGEGTTVRLRLPLTLAVIKALLFEVGRRLYAIPVSAVTDVTRIVTDELVTVDGKDTFLLRDRIISVIRLQELLNGDVEDDKRKFILIMGLGKKKIGVLVDRLKGQQELVIKAVDDWYMKSGLVTGASILGNGGVVLILDAPAIFRKAIDDERERAVTA
ncbi:MAG: chemotaxis protein CheW [Thermodesulfovibrionales bacterium]